jgi:hypothetical protein
LSEDLDQIFHLFGIIVAVHHDDAIRDAMGSGGSLGGGSCFSTTTWRWLDVAFVPRRAYALPGHHGRDGECRSGECCNQ